MYALATNVYTFQYIGTGSSAYANTRHLQVGRESIRIDLVVDTAFTLILTPTEPLEGRHLLLRANLACLTPGREQTRHVEWASGEKKFEFERKDCNIAIFFTLFTQPVAWDAPMDAAAILDSGHRVAINRGMLASHSPVLRTMFQIEAAKNEYAVCDVSADTFDKFAKLCQVITVPVFHTKQVSGAPKRRHCVPRQRRCHFRLICAGLSRLCEQDSSLFDEIRSYEDAAALLELACRLQCGWMCAACEAVLARHASNTGYCIGCFTIAKRLGLEKLVSEAASTITAHVEELKATPEWGRLDKDDLTDMMVVGVHNKRAKY